MRSTPIRCVLNRADVEIAPAAAPSGLTVLDFIRRHRRLTGTKEGCKEGDCGACVVLVGELDESGSVRYAPMTSCMMPLAEAEAKHLVTIEGLDGCQSNTGQTNSRPTNTVQKEIVDAGASQCGFCTPGIVVSLMGRLMDGPPPAADPEELPRQVDRALSGHLCRCTGYRSLRDASTVAFESLESAQGVDGMVAAGELPDYFLAIPDRLRAVTAENSLSPTASPIAAGPVVAGGTDLYVQRGEELPLLEVTSLERWLPARRDLRSIDLENGVIRIGALTRFEDLAQSQLLRTRIPAIEEFMDLIASWQIRTRSTLGGNLINASPIGDLSVLMLALGAVAIFEDHGAARGGSRAGDGGPAHGDARRQLPLEDLYLGYKQLDRRPSEILVEVRIPDLDELDRADFEKVSKRRWLDIATVNSAVRLRVAGGVIEQARLAVGGVAPVPLYLRRTSAALIGQDLNLETLASALSLAQEEIAPISDVRGSADYKRLLVRNLLLAHFTKLFPDFFDAGEMLRTVAR